MSPRQPQSALPAFVSRQVTEARRFFLNLSPDRKAALEVVCGGVERMRPEYVVDRTDFAYFAVELVAEGEGTLTINGSQHLLSAGSVFAYGRRTPHTIVNSSVHGMRKYYVDFVGTRADRLLREAGLRPSANDYRVLSVGSLHELTNVFEMLIRDASKGGPVVQSIAASLTELLMLKVRQLSLPKGSVLPQSYSTYERIRRHIEKRFLHLHTAQDVANECNVTAVYLSRLFGRFSDCGAYQYLMRRKMNYAAGLLMNEGLLVKEIARRMEFNDAFQFSRAFKRVYGIPPSQLAGQTQ